MKAAMLFNDMAAFISKHFNLLSQYDVIDREYNQCVDL